MSDHKQLQELVAQILSFFQQRKQLVPRIMLYGHGGLISEKKAAQMILRQHQGWLQHGVYPVYFVWESDLLSFVDTLLIEYLEHFVHPAGEASGRTLQDSWIENIVAALRDRGFDPWGAMKERASHVFADSNGGAQFLDLLTTALQEAGLQAEFHIVGHSAGANLMGALLQQLPKGRWPFTVSTCTLLAPACTLQLFEQAYMPAVEQGMVQHFFLQTLSEQGELKDALELNAGGPFTTYSHSLLYLVSRGFEGGQEAVPILGMHVFAKDNQALQNLIRQGRGCLITANEGPVYYQMNDHKLELSSCSMHHGGYGLEPCSMLSALRVVTGDNSIATFPFSLDDLQ